MASVVTILFGAIAEVSPQETQTVMNITDTTAPIANNSPPPRTIRSFVCREGRMTSAQKRVLMEEDERLLARQEHYRWEEIFAREAPCVLEIGFGNGESLLQQALERPEQDYLGIEVHRPGAGHLLLQAKAKAIQNLRVMVGDAAEMIHDFPPESFDRILILFPDPWHKTRHHKRRLIQKTLLTLLTDRLKLQGELQMATDWQDYARHMIAVVRSEPRLVNIAGQDSFCPPAYQRPMTKFEQRGYRLGHKVWEIVLRREQH